MRRIEQDVSRIPRPKFQAVATLQLLPLDALSVYICAMFAAQIDEEEIRPFLGDVRVIAGHPRIGNDQILVDLAADIKRSAVQDDVLLLAALNKHQGRKYPGTRAVMTD